MSGDSVKSKVMIKMNNGEVFYYTGYFNKATSSGGSILRMIRKYDTLDIDKDTSIATSCISSLYVIDRNI